MNSSKQSMRMAECCRMAVAMAVLVSLGAWPVSSTADEPYPVAGLTPGARPKGAPTVTVFERPPEWRAKALKGVSEPYPAGLGFLDNQGAWYTPFNRAGMPGPYDLRGLHAPGVTAAASSPENKK